MRRLLSAMRHRRAGLGDDSGFALITVLGIGTVMTALMLASLGYALQVAPQARRDQDWNAALAAAQAGVDDYVSRLNKSDSYALSVDCANPAVKGPAQAPACTWGPTTPLGWQSVKPNDPTRGQFHYDPVYAAGSVRLVSTGKVRNAYRTIDVRVARGGSTDFLYYTDFENADPANTVVYPSGTTDDCGDSGPATGKYWYQAKSGYAGTLAYNTRTNHRESCTEIAFAGGDVLDGRVHFNDTPGMGGSTSGGTGSQPTFTQGYETSDPNCPVVATINPTAGTCWRILPYTGNNTASGKPFFTTVGAFYEDRLDLPDNSTEFVNYPGCQYYGDTRIRFNSNGTMTVWNTLSAGQTIIKPGTPAGTSCGTASNFAPTSASDPRPPSTAGQTIPVPTDMVIYVRNSGDSETCVPGQIVNGATSGSTATDVIPQGSGNDVTANTDINFYDPSTMTQTIVRPFTKTTANGSAWNRGTATITRTPASDAHPRALDCGQGNVYVEGTVNGRVTIAAENNVIVTNNLLLSSTAAAADPVGTDIVGLVAGNSVQVYHPVVRSSSVANVTRSKNPSSSAATCSTTTDANPTNSPSGVTSVSCTWVDRTTYGNSYDDLPYPGATSSSSTRWIYASIQTLQHSFMVQAYSRGDDQGTLGVKGSIAQRYRGIVRSGSAGYLKDYGYDSRLKFSSPPYFPQWTNATWSAATTGELKPKYTGQ